MQELLTWARKAQEIFVRRGETDFSELANKDKDVILEELANTDYEFDIDGDCDAAYLIYTIGDVTISFTGHSESGFPEDMLGCLDDMDIKAGGEYVDINGLVEHLENQIEMGRTSQ